MTSFSQLCLLLVLVLFSNAEASSFTRARRIRGAQAVSYEEKMRSLAGKQKNGVETKMPETKMPKSTGPPKKKGEGKKVNPKDPEATAETPPPPTASDTIRDEPPPETTLSTTDSPVNPNTPTEQSEENVLLGTNLGKDKIQSEEISSQFSVSGLGTGLIIAGAGLALSIVFVGLVGQYGSPAKQHDSDDDCPGKCPSDEDSEAEDYQFRKVAGLVPPDEGVKISSLQEGKVVQQFFVKHEAQYQNDRERLRGEQMQRNESFKSSSQSGRVVPPSTGEVSSQALQIDMSGNIRQWDGGISNAHKQQALGRRGDSVTYFNENEYFDSVAFTPHTRAGQPVPDGNTQERQTESPLILHDGIQQRNDSIDDTDDSSKSSSKPGSQGPAHLSYYGILRDEPQMASPQSCNSCPDESLPRTFPGNMSQHNPTRPLDRSCNEGLPPRDMEGSSYYGTTSARRGQAHASFQAPPARSYDHVLSREGSRQVSQNLAAATLSPSSLSPTLPPTPATTQQQCAYYRDSEQHHRLRSTPRRSRSKEKIIRCPNPTP